MKDHCNPKCCLCGNDGEVLFRDLRDNLWNVPGKWNMIRCTSPACGLLWIDPMPNPAEISKLYSSYYTHSQDNASRGLAFNLFECVRKAVLASRFGYTEIARSGFWRFAGRALAYLPTLTDRVGRTVMWLSAADRGQLLDLGCGDGRLLARMKDAGWEVVGLEPDHKAAEIAAGKYNFQIHEGSLEEAAFDEAVFDAITMAHVLEHLPDPLATLKESLRILRPGGRLAIVTPNSASLGLRRYGPDWRGLEPPRHLHLFGPAAIRHAAERAGFAVKLIKSVSCCGASVWLNSDYLRAKRTGVWQDPKDCGFITRQSRKLAHRLRRLLYTVWQTVMYWIDPNSPEEILLLAEKPR